MIKHFHLKNKKNAYKKHITALKLFLLAEVLLDVYFINYQTTTILPEIKTIISFFIFECHIITSSTHSIENVCYLLKVKASKGDTV